MTDATTTDEEAPDETAGLGYETARAQLAYGEVMDLAISLGGTITGEHGVGLHKMGFLVDEAGVGAVAMMRTIKQALDPDNIMNPGKVFSL